MGQSGRTKGVTIATPELNAHFKPRDSDPLIVHSLLWDEVAQRRESGYDVDSFVDRANLLDPTDDAAILDLVDSMESATRSDWAFQEPDAAGFISARRAERSTPRPAPADYDDKVHAAWLGRIIGCNLGKPVEWGDHWTVDHIERYLRLADAYPLTDYIPLIDPLPAEFDLNASCIHSTRGHIDGSARDDDIDYSILALMMLEQHGRDLTPEHVGAAWIELLPLLQTYTAERATYINLARGLTPPRTATYRNPYREWIGAQIRGDVFGYVNPGDPWAAAEIAYQDASLSHVGNGVYGEMWSAALTASAFTAADARDAVERSLEVVPPGSRLAEAVTRMLALHTEGVSWQEARRTIADHYGHYSWVHTINNAAVVALGLLWGSDDFTTSVGLTVMSGLDTDSNGATVGSVAGILTGVRGLPSHFVTPIDDRVRSALFGCDDLRISQLARRTVVARANLERSN